MLLRFSIHHSTEKGYDLDHSLSLEHRLNLGVNQNPRHALLDKIIYGPVLSRRMGLSLGINLLPINQKLCNFDCVYCQLGRNQPNTRFTKDEYPTAIQISSCLQDWIDKYNNPQFINCITFSGNGEPTLNPHFSEIAHSVFELRQKFLARSRLILLTNGTKIHLARIQKTLHLFDEVCVKYDPAPKLSNQTNTAYSTIQSQFSNLHSLPNLVLQSCLFSGEIENLTHAYSMEWWQPILALKPKRVDLYTIDEAATPKTIKAVSMSEIQKLKRFLLDKKISCECY